MGAPVALISLVTMSLVWKTLAAAQCGVTGGLTSGTLQSPNYPSSYGPNQFCIWTIRAGEWHLIEITFQGAFQMEASDTCGYDSVELIDVDPQTGNAIKSKKFCGSQRPGPYKSSSSMMYVRFTSDGSNEYSGFSLSWKRTRGLHPANNCTFQMDGDSGSLEHPRENLHPQTRRCTWHISVPLGKVIRLLFNSTFDLGVKNSKTCYGDTIQIYDVMANGSQVIRGQWCRNDQPPETTSFTSRMTVVLLRGLRIGPTTFSAVWTAENSCNGMSDAPQGYFMSYNYPDNSLTQSIPLGLKNCQWEIAVPHDYRVTLTVHRPENNTDCRNLQILSHRYNELNRTVVPRQDWCVSDTQDHGMIDYNMTDHNMTDHNRTDHDTTDHSTTDHSPTTISRLELSSSRVVLLYSDPEGAPSALYVSWKTECGQTVSDPEGNFSSPGYGVDYPPSLDCEWVILGLKDHTVRLDFRSVFDIETSNDHSCHYDYVEVLDSSSEGSLTSHGRFCGTTPPPMLISSSQKVVVRFHSDQSKQGKGFSLSWNTDCGDVYTSLQGNVTSPGFPSSYPNNFDCRWEIRIPDGYSIELSFGQPFSLEGNAKCDADYLEIYDFAQNETSARVGRWCGENTPPLYTSVSSHLLIIFHSDWAKSHRGFQAQWDAGKRCGREFASPNGTFTSPGFPQPYPDNLRCHWNILAVPGQRLKLDFGSTFDLEISKDDCGYDSVEVLESLSNGTLVSYGKWCSLWEIPVFHSWFGLVVLFYSDSGKSGRGFSASWESVTGCDDTLTSGAGHLMSPNFPSDYPEYRECHWTIQPHGQGNVTLHFDSLFALEGDPDCVFDYVEIYLANQIVGRWCGTTPPPDITSGGQLLEVKFKSDKSVNDAGFFASWG